MAPSKKQKPTADEPTVQAAPQLVTRIIAPMQSAGRVGKSTLNDSLLTWLESAGVHFGALDCDSEHHTLSDRYEGFIRAEAGAEQDADMPLFTLSDPEAVRKLLGGIVSQAKAEVIPPVIVLDFPAQKTEDILADFQKYNALELFAQNNIRLTIPLFLLDDPAAAASLGKIVQTFGDRVDYIFVKNPKRGKSTQIEQRRVIREMLDAGTPTIELPSVTDETMLKAVPAAERREGRYLPLAKVAPLIDDVGRMELESFLWQMSCQFEDAADVILPNKSLIQTWINRTKYPRPSSHGTNSTAPRAKREMSNLD